MIIMVIVGNTWNYELSNVILGLDFRQLFCWGIVCRTAYAERSTYANAASIEKTDRISRGGGIGATWRCDGSECDTRNDAAGLAGNVQRPKIGRASCRERVW